jgi:hypothetical protein
MDIISQKIKIGEKNLKEYVINNKSNKGNGDTNRQADIDSLIELQDNDYPYENPDNLTKDFINEADGYLTPSINAKL